MWDGKFPLAPEGDDARLSTGQQASAGIRQPVQPQGLLSQRFACLALRQFHNLGCRRTQALLADTRDLCRAIKLKRPPDHNTLCDAFDTLARLDVFAPMLDELVAALESAELLKLDGKPLAVDSSHYESHHVSRHFERRKRKSQEKADRSKTAADARRSATHKKLPKLAIAVACACHLVLSMGSGTGVGPDHGHFQTLACHAWRRAPVRTIVADAGYDSENAHCLVRDEMGCQSLIPPEAGRPSENGPRTHHRRLMTQLLAKGTPQREQYGQRWQAETVNSMMKRNYGSALRARTPQRRERELLLKVMVHNIAL